MPKRRELGWRSGLLLSGAAVVLTALIFEVVARVYLAFVVGPDVLLYGIVDDRVHAHAKHTVAEHANESDGYSKYFPRQKRVDYDKDTGEKFEVTINAEGFRGSDFPTGKAFGVTRVVTMGASSTFGYHDRDDETYPVQLETYLNANCDAPGRFEVLNLGIPHQNSENIVAIFENEALPLQPDVATVYTGANDAAWKSSPKVGAVRPVRFRLSAFSILHLPYRIARDHLILGKLADAATLQYDAAEVQALLGNKRERFVGNLQRLLELAREHGVRLVVSNQQATSYIVDRKHLAGVTYDEEHRLLLRHLEEEGSVNRPGLYLLHHTELMKALEEWATGNDVPFVDSIRAMDDERNDLVSWVHLTARGNQILARSFGDEILRVSCPGEAMRDAVHARHTSPH